MNTLITRSPNAEALRAELHRDELLREATASRLARASSLDGTPAATTTGTSLIGRVRSALGSVGRTAQPECPECA